MENYINTKSYHDRPLIWKILNLWYIPVSILIPVFLPFSLLYIGLIAKSKKWVRIFALVTTTLVTSTVLLLANMDSFGKFFAIPIALAAGFTIVYIIAAAGDFLRRLDIILRNGTLFKEEDRNGLNVDRIRKKNEPAALFIDSMRNWQQEIESIQMKKCIQQLIEIVGIVLETNNEEDAKRFFLRYHDTLNEMLKKYDEFENSKLSTPEIKGVMKNIESGMDTIIIALRNDATTMHKNNILDANAETAAFIQDLRNRGLLEKELRVEN